jgi:cell division protein FtsL
MNPYFLVTGLLLAVLLLGLGYWWRSRLTVIERQQLRAGRRALDVEWNALRQVQQLGHLMYWGRQQMREEEQRAGFGLGGKG